MTTTETATIPTPTTIIRWALELVDGRTVTVDVTGGHFYPGVRVWDGQTWTDVLYRRRLT